MITPHTDPDRFTTEEAGLWTRGLCSWQVAYGTVTPSSTVGRITYCMKPSDPVADFGDCPEHAADRRELR